MTDHSHQVSNQQNLSNSLVPAQTVLVKQYKHATIVKATYEHIEDVAKWMRREDVKEIACLGHTPQTALQSGLDKDDVTLAVLNKNGVAFAMFGVGRWGAQAYIWMLSTNEIEGDCKYEFIRASKEWTQRLVKPYQTAVNYVHKDNTTHLRWLKFCGANFIREVQINGHPFVEFIITT